MERLRECDKGGHGRADGGGGMRGERWAGRAG